MEYLYFCFGCGQINNGDEFQINEMKSRDIQILNCQKCKQQTICIQCLDCKMYKYCIDQDINKIIQCVCGSKQRNFKCNFCKNALVIKDKNLKQTTEICCHFCKNNFYIINCPDCQSMKFIASSDKIIFCSECNLSFRIDECKLCKEVAFSRDQVEPFFFKCQKNHQYMEIKCVQCNKINKINGTQEINYKCQFCATNMKKIICLCGQNQIRKTTNDQVDKFKCIKCTLEYKIIKCNSNGCSFPILQLIKPPIEIKETDTGPFNEITNIFQIYFYLFKMSYSIITI
ncbi:unnamed protein product [Paramecium sonneborni]|uniref:Uncharacterized protein n=1 Tax=Paramecium sonneborni TaxID=65129 RepID=A0A8S1QJJ9_9CILI|nr:unnamed protein product [Paramecium sonneborni]